jgi:glycolate oxidase iron-sulfur subunit
MQTNLSSEYKNRVEGQEAEEILRKCVHCGFCTATCPTYQLLGDELDGPRGRIYLIKQVLEGEAPTRKTQMHLDRCLTCRNCETTCPSGVQYGHLVDIGRKLVDEKVTRPAAEKALRWALKEGLPSPLFAPAMAMGQLVRPLLPKALKRKIPVKTTDKNSRYAASNNNTSLLKEEHSRKMLMLQGCVQPSMSPNINAATQRVLNAAGIQTIVAKKAGCCGAVKFHLNDQDGGKAQMRANIDAWWPYVQSDEGKDASGGVQAIVMNASGCGVTVKEYGHILQHDAQYAAKAARISELTKDLSELLPELVTALKPKLKAASAEQLAFHPPCTLQHGQKQIQKQWGGVETHLAALGFNVKTASCEAHLCCGSAGTYSVLQPELAYQLRDRKLGHLQEMKPHTIISANIGCISHLQSGTDVPVRHWVEILDSALAA